MTPTTLLRYLEIVAISCIMFVVLVGVSTVLSGLVFHGPHSHLFLEREHWTCAQYSPKSEILAYKEQDCIVYRRNY